MAVTTESERFEPADPGIGRPRLPIGRTLTLPGRGDTFIRELAGPAGAPTVMLLHGWTVSAALNWFPVYEPLSAIASVVSIDHRGHGRGIRSATRFRLVDAADDAIALADELDLDRFVVAGYSMGGAIAQLIAHRRPDRIRGVVLAATWARKLRGELNTRLLQAAGPAARGSRLIPPERQVDLFTWGYTKASGRQPETPPQWFIDEVMASSVPMVLDAGGEMARFDSRSWLPALEMPVGIAITTRDTLVGADTQHRMASLVPHARIRSIPIDHDGCVTEPDLFVPPFVDLVTHAASAR